MFKPLHDNDSRGDTYITLVTASATVARLADALARRHVAHVLERAQLGAAARLATIIRNAPVAGFATLAAPTFCIATEEMDETDGGNKNS